MSQSGTPDSVVIQKLLLRAATAVVLGQPLTPQGKETKDDISQIIIAALNIISRSSRLEAVVSAARPVASRLASESELGEDNEERRRAEAQALIGALAALNAFDTREIDHTVID